MSDLKNNNNKFYKIQILVDEKTGTFHIYNRWGRVGYDGQTSNDPCNNKLDAQRKYDRKVLEKLGKGYFEIEVDYNDNNGKEIKTNENRKENTKEKTKENDITNNYKFDINVKKLLEFIFDLKLMNQQMKEIGYDANKMPLGKISQNMIKNGYDILCKIEAVIRGETKGDLYELSSSFYTIIPHNFGFQ
jgi:poly [ADP-ribose] polymerase